MNRKSLTHQIVLALLILLMWEGGMLIKIFHWKAYLIAINEAARTNTQ
jgi:hypothetical protein